MILNNKNKNIKKNYLTKKYSPVIFYYSRGLTPVVLKIKFSKRFQKPILSKG